MARRNLVGIGAPLSPWEGDPERPVAVKVSAKMARLRFHGCEPAYIRDVCKGRCCESSSAPGGTLISILPLEASRLERLGATVKDGLLLPRPGERRCPFKTVANLCGLHETDDKPFGCIASPFTLNRYLTLIVRNRYKLLRCHRPADQRLPAYIAFESSLYLLFGRDVGYTLVQHLNAGGGDRIFPMAAKHVRWLLGNDATKRTALAEQLPMFPREVLA